jgi:abhydrolase domain-containing protein 11
MVNWKHLCFQPELVEKLVVVDISPVAVSPGLSIMPKYFEAMMSVKLVKNIPLSKARRMADEHLAKYVLVGVLKIIVPVYNICNPKSR